MRARRINQFSFRLLLLTQLFSFCAIAQEDVDTAKKAYPTVIRLKPIELSTSFNGWYDVEGGIELTKGRHQLSFDVSSGNLMWTNYRIQTWSYGNESNFRSGFLSHPTRGSWMSFFPHKGDRRGTRLSTEYVFDLNNGKKGGGDFSFKLGHDWYRSFHSSRDSTFTTFLNGPLTSNFFRGSDSLNYQRRAHEFILELSGSGKSPHSLYFDLEVGFNLPERTYQHQHDRDLYSSSDSLLNRMSANHSGSWMGYQGFARSSISQYFDKISWTLNGKGTMELANNNFTQSSNYSFAGAAAATELARVQEYAEDEMEVGIEVEWKPFKSLRITPSFTWVNEQTNSRIYADSLGVIQSDAYHNNETQINLQAYVPALSIIYKKSPFSVSLTSQYRIQRFDLIQRDFSSDSIRRNRSFFLNDLSMKYYFENDSKLTLNYSSDFWFPSMELLQANAFSAMPFFWTTGVSTLEQSIDHTVSLEFSTKSYAKFMFEFQAEMDYDLNPFRPIAQLATTDTVLLSGWNVPSGNVWYSYENFDQAFATWAQTAFTFKMEKIKSELEVGSRFNFDEIPLTANGQSSNFRQYAYRFYASTNSKLFKERVIMEFFYAYSDIQLENSLSTITADEFNIQRFEVSLFYRPKKLEQLSFSTDYEYAFNTGLSSGFDRQTNILSFEIEYKIKLQKNTPRRLKVGVELRDLFNQSIYLERYVTPMNIQDRLSTSTGRLLLFSLELNLGVVKPWKWYK